MWLPSLALGGFTIACCILAAAGKEELYPLAHQKCKELEKDIHDSARCSRCKWKCDCTYSLGTCEGGRAVRHDEFEVTCETVKGDRPLSYAVDRKVNTPCPKEKKEEEPTDLGVINDKSAAVTAKELAQQMRGTVHSVPITTARFGWRQRLRRRESVPGSGNQAKAAAAAKKAKTAAEDARRAKMDLRRPSLYGNNGETMTPIEVPGPPKEVPYYPPEPLPGAAAAANEAKKGSVEAQVYVEEAAVSEETTAAAAKEGDGSENSGGIDKDGSSISISNGSDELDAFDYDDSAEREGHFNLQLQESFENDISQSSPPPATTTTTTTTAPGEAPPPETTP
eukprot:GHVU01191430.1.p1 GENE.GHVU01191430.1~~GHVU01191430.1.p1  ORF type:complete len:338 (-),score=73.61 GHVU01191430.1:45-1058(-)